MKKSELKAIIKECLVEILADGLGSTLTESVKNKKPANQQMHMGLGDRSNGNPNNFITYGNSKNTQQRLAQTPNNRLQENIQELTNDPILSSIFQDTAQNSNLNRFDESLQRSTMNPNHLDGGVDLSVFANLTSNNKLTKNWEQLTFDKKNQHS
jgi:hypothetical protein